MVSWYWGGGPETTTINTDINLSNVNTIPAAFIRKVPTEYTHLDNKDFSRILIKLMLIPTAVASKVARSLGIWVRISLEAQDVRLWCLLCVVKVAAPSTGSSLVQGSPTGWAPNCCDLETSTMRRSKTEFCCSATESKQPMYNNVTVRWRSNKYWIFWVCVCSLKY